MEIVLTLIVLVTLFNFYATFKLFKDYQKRNNILFDMYNKSQTYLGGVWIAIQKYEYDDFVNREGAYEEIERNWRHYIDK